VGAVGSELCAFVYVYVCAMCCVTWGVHIAAYGLTGDHV